MGKLGHVFGTLHEGFVDIVSHQDAAERRGTAGDALGEGDYVGDDAVALGGKAWPSRPKPVITSSKISRMPCARVISRKR